MKTPAINISQKSEEYNMVLLSQLYHPAELSQTIQQQGEAKPRRRRRRNGKGGETRLLGAKKRKLTDEQVTMLELNFGNEHKLETERKDKLALELGLHPRQVAIWFQNRRARYKNKQLEEEYMILKKEHERVVLQKCALESEVLRLKEKLGEAETEKQWMVIQQQLAEADKEIKKLKEGCGENSHNIGSPQLTIKTEDTAVNDVTDTPFLDPYTPQAPFNLTGEDNHHHHHHHHQEPTPSLDIEEQHRQDGSDMTDDRGGDVVISYWTGHYGDIMFDNGSLWDDGYFK